MKPKNLNGRNRVLKKIKDYFYLLVSMSVVTIFVLFLAPCMDDAPYVKPLTNFIDDEEINAGAIYYSDIEEFSIAEINMKNTIDYLPCFNPGKKEEKK